MREINVLLTAVGRRTYLVDYFREALLPCGGKVYAANCLRDATGLMAADGFEIVPKSADAGYVDRLLELCRRWRISLLFSLHDWDAPVIARSRERFLDAGTVPVMADADVLSACLDKYATAREMKRIGVPVPWTTLSLDEAAEEMKSRGCEMVVKPRWGQGSVGLFKVGSGDELEWAYRLSDSIARRRGPRRAGRQVEPPSRMHGLRLDRRRRRRSAPDRAQPSLRRRIPVHARRRREHSPRVRGLGAGCRRRRVVRRIPAWRQGVQGNRDTCVRCV